MKIPIGSFLLIQAMIINTQPLIAQDPDTLKAAIPERDSLPHLTVSRSTVKYKNVFRYTAFAAPVALVAYGFISLHTDVLQDVNETVKEEVYTDRSPHVLHIDNYLQYAPAIAVYGLNAAGIHGANNFRDRTMIYGISSLIMGTSVYALKKVTHETRPDGSDNLSFPSGHTATAFAAAEFLRQEYKGVSVWYGVGGYAAAVFTGFLRITNNKHWIGDVLAGAGLGVISTRLAYCIYPCIKRSLFGNKEVHTIILPAYQNGVLALGLIHHF
jgi:hypothetical protein